MDNSVKFEAISFYAKDCFEFIFIAKAVYGYFE